MSEELGFKLTVDEGNAAKSVKSFKQELKEATVHALEMSREFGELSPQAIAATKALGKLKEEMADVQELTAAVTDEKRFTAFANFAGSLAGGFSAAQGAIGLVSGESEELEAVLLRVQSAMALSQGLSQVADLGRQWGVAKAALNSFTVVQKANELATKAAAVVQKLFTGAVDTTSGGFNRLKVAIIGTGIGALVVAIGYVVANFDKLKKMIFDLIPGLEAVADFIGGIIDAVTDFVGATSDATREADSLRDGLERQNEEYENQIKLLEAQGATSKQVRALKNAMYEDELSKLRRIMALTGELSEAELKRFRELKIGQQVIDAENKKEDRDNAEKEKKKQEEETKKQVEAQRQRAKKLAEERKRYQEKQIEEERKKDNEIQEQYEKEQEKLISDMKERHAFQLELMKIQGEDTRGVREQQIDEEIQQLKESGGRFLEGIAELEREKVLVAAQAKADAMAEQKEIDDKNAEEQKEVEEQLKEEADALREESEANDLLRVQEKYDRLRELVHGNESLMTQIVAAEAEAKAGVEKKWDDIRLQQKRENMSALGGLLGGASNLIGKNTAVGKGLAVAEATVQTYLGATKALSASSSIPIVGTALGIANAALIVASGIKSVTTILKTKVPGQADAGGAPPVTPLPAEGSSPSVSTAPSMDGIQSTLLDQTKKIAEGKDSLKAYVVESEITQKQERANAITQTANF
jgi:hypothetical protein